MSSSGGEQVILNRAEQCIGRPVLVEGERRGDALRVDHDRGHILIRQYESPLVLRTLRGVGLGKVCLTTCATPS